MHPAHGGVVQDMQLRRQAGLLAGVHHLQLHRGILQLRQAPLQQHLTLIHDAHMVTDILQLPQVMAGYQHRGTTLRHVPQQQGPHLPPHHRVQTVHRLIQNEVLRHTTHGQPEGRLLLHPLAHAPQHLAVIQGEHLLHLLVSLPGEGGVRPGVQLRHLGNGRLREIVPVVGDHHHAPLGVGVLPNGSALQQQLAAVGAVYAGKVADDGGLSGAVGANQPIYRPLGYGEGGPVPGSRQSS